MILEWVRYKHKLKQPFRIAHGSYESRDAVIVRIQAGPFSGLGEATVINYYGQTMEGMISILQAMKNFLRDMEFEHPPLIWEKLHDEFGDEASFCLSAVDCALWDIRGKSQELSVRELLYPGKSDFPPTSFTIGGGSADEMGEKIRQNPWPVYKLKTGMLEDLQLIGELRKSTGKPFRIDANGALDEKTATALWPELEGMGVELAEQPYPPALDHRVPELKKLANIPCIADESCQIPEDLKRLSHCFDGINIKLMKCGGLTPAVRMAEIAKDLGMSVMVGCMTESSIGIAASACLLPAADYADLDGAMLLAHDPAKSVNFERGYAVFPSAPGLGITLKEKLFN